MQAEIIAVGTELLLGHTINSDAAHVGRELSALGIDVFHSCVVGDNPQRLEEALREGLSRSDLVITTGGLGPTEDDLTKETIAAVLEMPLEEDADSLARLKEYFGERRMGPNQYKQVLLPRGSRALPNRIGTAPGCYACRADGKAVAMLPGPPRELLPMLREQLVPILAARTNACICSHMIRTFAQGEGDAALRLAELTGLANPSTATYATDGEMFVRVTAKAETAEAAEALAAPTLQRVRDLLGDVVYGVDVDNLESVVVPELARRGQTVATAESCTGGLLAAAITDVPGSSAVFGTGVVTYANESKMRLLGIEDVLLARVGAVSEEVARQMAAAVRERGGSDWGIGITGIAGPDGGTAEKPVGLVYIALADANRTWLRVMRPQGRYMGRQWTRRRAVGHGLDMLRRAMAGLEVELQASERGRF